MSDKRVKFYSSSDMSVGFYLERMQLVIDSQLTSAITDINDVLELVNILKFIDSGIYDKRWSKAFQKKVKDSKPFLHKIIVTFFKGLNSKTLATEIKQLDVEYTGDFIDQFEKFDLGSMVNEEDFKLLIDSSDIPYWDIAGSAYLVKKYPDAVKGEFLSKPRHFELFLNNFTSSTGSKLLVPDNVSKADMLQFCKDYIESEAANINYLRILSRPLKGIEKHLNIDASTRLKAKRKAAQLENELFKDRMDEGGLQLKMAVLSSKSTYDKEIAKAEETDLVALVDGEWIDKHHDFPTLFNNIQYLYDLFSSDLISELPSFPKREMGVFETHMGVNTNSSYVAGQFFTMKQQFTTMKLKAFSELLARHNVSIEDMIDWFFSTYSKEEFGVKWLPLSMPSRSEAIANQTATLLRIEEHIRKQYHALKLNGTIDSELVDISNTPSFNELRSFTDKKYIYLSDSEEMQIIINLLFSDQSSITYINDSLKGEHFVALITGNKVKYSELHEYQKPIVKHLIDRRVVMKNGDGVLSLCNSAEVKVLRRLYYVGVIGYNHISSTEKSTIDNMIDNEMVILGSTLYSKQEQDYLNFILNNSFFDDSWAIRNSYQHGLPSYDNPNHYEFDNLLVKLILVTHVIKINDELTQRKVTSGGDGAYCEIDEY